MYNTNIEICYNKYAYWKEDPFYDRHSSAGAIPRIL